MPPHPANHLRHLREAHLPPWTQDELAERAQVDPSRLRAYERGEALPSLPNAIALALALGEPVEALFYGLTWEVRGQLVLPPAPLP
jgi:DNA-binding XRE family transcriptional regulator